MPYGSLLNYIPNGIYDQAIKSRSVIDKVKGGNEKIVENLIDLIESREDAVSLKKFLTNDALLVPVPRSSLIMPGAVWPSKIIAEELLKKGFGKVIKCVLERKTAIRKSSQQKAENRPSIKEHIDSLHVVMPAELTDPKTIILIDDVVTKGSIAIACCICLRQIYPDHEIKLFTIARTQSFSSKLELNALEAHINKINYYKSGECFRDPT